MLGSLPNTAHSVEALLFAGLGVVHCSSHWCTEAMSADTKQHAHRCIYVCTLHICHAHLYARDYNRTHCIFIFGCILPHLIALCIQMHAPVVCSMRAFCYSDSLSFSLSIMLMTGRVVNGWRKNRETKR